MQVANITRIHGSLDDALLLSMNQALHGCENLGEARVLVSDFSKVNEVKLSSLTVRKVAARDAVLSCKIPGIDLAMVTSNRSLYAMLRMYQMIMESGQWRVRLFDNLEEMEAWLDTFKPIEIAECRTGPVPADALDAGELPEHDWIDQSGALSS